MNLLPVYYLLSMRSWIIDRSMSFLNTRRFRSLEIEKNEEIHAPNLGTLYNLGFKFGVFISGVLFVIRVRSAVYNREWKCMKNFGSVLELQVFIQVALDICSKPHQARNLISNGITTCVPSQIIEINFLGNRSGYRENVNRCHLSHDQPQGTDFQTLTQSPVHLNGQQHQISTQVRIQDIFNRSYTQVNAS